MRIVPFVIVLVLGCVLLITTAKNESSEDTTRNALIFDLGSDIVMFIEEGKLSGEDRKAAYGIWVLLVSNPPLKTFKEMREDDRKVTKYPSPTHEKLLKEKMREKTQEILSGTQLANRPLTDTQTYDLFRLDLLKEIFENADLGSEALDLLYEKVLESIWLTSEA